MRITVEFESLEEFQSFSNASAAQVTARRTTGKRTDKTEPATLVGGIDLFKSDASPAETLATSAEAAKKLVEILKAAPDRASLDNILTVNARAMQMMEEKDSGSVTRAYSDMTSKFAAAPAQQGPKPEPKAETPKAEEKKEPETNSLDDLMGEVGEDTPKGLPADPKVLKEEVRDLVKGHIAKIGMVKGKEWMTPYGETFSKIPVDKYPQIWVELSQLYPKA